MADKKIDLSQSTGTKEASVVEEKSTTQKTSTRKNVESANETTTKLTPTDNSPANVTPALDPSAKRRISFKKLVPVVVLLLAAGILLGITGGWNRFVGGGSTQRTDDAFLRADITPLSTRVSGTVAQVAVTDYQRVKAGDLLVQLKDDDFKAQVGQAEAGVAAAQAALENNAKQKELQSSRIMQAEAGVQAANAEIAQAGATIEAARSDVANGQASVDNAQAKIPDTQATVEAAQADAERTLLERKRQEALVELGSATKQKLEQVVADQERFAAVVESRNAELAQTRALVEMRRAELSKARAQVSMRQAEQQRARAQLSSRSAELDAQIKQRAVLDAQEQQLQADLNAKQEALVEMGSATKKKLEQVVADQERFAAILDSSKAELAQARAYLESRRADLSKTHAGVASRRAERLRAKAQSSVPGVTLRGHVEEIAPASGSQFALLPPDNATGNYTKIVQRIPVKIVLDPNPDLANRLRPGMSVIAKISTKARKV